MNHSTVTSTVSTPLCFGLDVGDTTTHLCCVDESREVVERQRFKTTRKALARVFGDRPPSRIVLEVGSQSPWMSTLLRELGHDVTVADARRVAAITRSGRKTDRKDAETLARLLQGMPELLGSVYHRGPQAQADLAKIRARDLLVRTRTRLVQHVRGTLKGFGLRVRSCTAPVFHLVAAEQIPESLLPALRPILEMLSELRDKIRELERALAHAAKDRYPVTERLREVAGVGPLVSLAFVLTVEDPKRFAKSRTVGAWVGLCPDVKSSGDHDPALSITKTGCPYLRRLLVQSAQYILGPFGPDSDLKRYGLRICERGGKAAKGRAVAAVARKLAVLLHRLWMTDAPYRPLKNSKEAAMV